jgi:hypothetical protein
VQDVQFEGLNLRCGAKGVISEARADGAGDDSAWRGGLEPVQGLPIGRGVDSDVPADDFDLVNG